MLGCNFSSIALHSNKEEKARTLPTDADIYESSGKTLMLQEDLVTCAGELLNEA